MVMATEVHASNVRFQFFSGSKDLGPAEVGQFKKRVSTRALEIKAGRPHW